MSAFYNSNNKVLAKTSELTSIVSADLQSKTLLPRGSALMTSAGHLSPDISAIFHAATGTMYTYLPEQLYYEPSLESVEDSISACFELCKMNGTTSIAVPYIGGNLFKQRIFKGQEVSDEEKDSKLIASIVKSTLDSAHSSGCGYCFMAFDEKTYSLFSNELKSSNGIVDPDKHLKRGDITDFQVHHCDGIVNAANMEVAFGGGISHAIAQATKNSLNIDQEAKGAITKFWTDYENS